MGICWYCYWGWPKPVAEIYLKALADLDGNKRPLHYGPSHVVWEDENFDFAEWCIEHFDEYRGDFSDSELVIVLESLKELAALPMDIKCVEPEDYDNEHPALYPPDSGVEMVRV